MITNTYNYQTVKFQTENIDKEKLSSILTINASMYKQHIYYLNEEENRYLIEFRDVIT